jgi:hypothetical protein
MDQVLAIRLRLEIADPSGEFVKDQSVSVAFCNRTHFRRNLGRMVVFKDAMQNDRLLIRCPQLQLYRIAHDVRLHVFGQLSRQHAQDQGERVGAVRKIASGLGNDLSS